LTKLLAISDFAKRYGNSIESPSTTSITIGNSHGFDEKINSVI